MNDELQTITLESTGPAYNIRAQAVWIGPDLLVSIWGGEAPHIGAVAMAEPRPSLADAALTSSTASVFTYLGHKEDELARSAALAISAALEAKVVVTAGIHWDNLDREAIETVISNSNQLVSLIIKELKQ